MDAISVLLSQDEVDLEAVFAALPEMIDTSSQTDPDYVDLESEVPLGLAIKFANLVGLCLEANGKGFKSGQVRKLMLLLEKSKALYKFKPLLAEIREFTNKELAQLLYFSECLCEIQE